MLWPQRISLWIIKLQLEGSVDNPYYILTHWKWVAYKYMSLHDNWMTKASLASDLTASSSVRLNEENSKR